MPCDRFKNCLKESPLDINQNVNDIDQLTCMTNTLLQCLSASCGINIDYNNILACNQSSISQMPLPPNSSGYLTTLADCKYGPGNSAEKTAFINRATNAFKTYQFFARSGSGLRVPVKCSSGTQTFSGPCDPSQCFITIKYSLNYQNFNGHKNLIDSLCATGPIMCDFDVANFPPDFEDWLKNVQNGTGYGPPPYIYTMPPGWKMPSQPKTDCASLLKSKHAILLVGGRCVSINGQDYIEYTFKDTYANIHGQVSWTIRVPITGTAPFNVGMSNPLGNRITSARITNCAQAKKDAEACCNPTPTPSVTSTRAPTPTPTKTRAPSVTSTPTPTKTKSAPTTATPTPTKTKSLSTPTPTRSYTTAQSLSSIP